LIPDSRADRVALEGRTQRAPVVGLQPASGPARRGTPADIDDWQKRLAADDQLVRLLEWEGFDGPESEKLYRALMEYGTAVIGAWLQSGGILAKCREKGVRVPDGEIADELLSSSTEREDITTDTIARAVVGFRDNVLKPHKWSSARGATLKTFFIGQALMRFANEYRDWLRARRKRPQTEPLEGALAHAVMPSPEAALLRREELHAELMGVRDRRVRQIVVLHALGYRHKEIAELLDLGSDKVVETQLYRLRKREKRDDVA
jgi:DNA-directed RNA polymerase specialized sigma24 family protein